MKYATLCTSVTTAGLSMFQEH